MRDMTAKRTETILIGMIAAGIVIANFWHVLVSWIAMPPGTYFTWIAHYYADYFLYASQIAEGIRGNRFVSRSLFTNEPVAATWVYWPNVLIGNLGSMTGLSAFSSYSASLFLLVITLLFLIYAVTKRLFPTNPLTRVIGFLFAVTASNFISLPSLFKTGTLTLWRDMWFSPTPALNRLGGVPHQALQTVLILSVILLFERVVTAKEQPKRSGRAFIALPLLCFLAATLSPIQLLLLCAAILLTTAIQSPSPTGLLSIGVSLMTAGIGAYLVNASFDASPVYAAAKNWESAQRVSVSLPAILLAMGPIIFFLPFGVPAFVRTLSPMKLVFILYGGLSLAVFVSPVPTLLHTSPIRWIHPASLLMYYLIAAEGLLMLSRLLTDTMHRRLPTLEKTTLMTVIMNVLLCLYCLITVPAIIHQVQSRMTPVLSSPLNYVPREDMAILTALAQMPESAVVLTDPTLPYDVMIPAIAGKRSFTGHPIHTLYGSTKEQLRTRFFSGQMTSAEAQKFLSDHTIGTVVYAYATAKPNPPYPFLRETFQNGKAAIYEVIR